MVKFQQSVSKKNVSICVQKSVNVETPTKIMIKFAKLMQQLTWSKEAKKQIFWPLLLKENSGVEKAKNY